MYVLGFNLWGKIFSAISDNIPGGNTLCKLYIGMYYKRYGFFSRFGLMKTDQLIRVSKRVPFSMEQQKFINLFLPKNLWISLGFWETAHLPLP